MSPLRSAIPATLLLLAGCGGGGGGSTAAARDPRGDIARGPTAATYAEVRPAGETIEDGLFDPSLADDGAGHQWLAYSFVHTGGGAIDTHIAMSADRGASWTFQAAINLSLAGSIDTPDGAHLDGVWRCEVPTLVHDAGDAAAPWKQFLHRYFWSPTRDRMPDYGWIAMRTAAQPQGPWSDEVALFAAGQFPRAPYHQQQVDLDALDPALAANVAYTEPGAFADGGTLYLSLTALRADGPYAIVVVASDDHGAHWRYAGAALTRDDATAAGYHAFDGSAVVAHGSERLLLATPVGDSPLDDGAVAFSFADLAHARLARGSDGRPIVGQRIPLQASSATSFGGGQSTYLESADAAGVLMPQLSPTAPAFRIYATGVRLGPPAAPIAGG